jgi:hypothetical protein
VWCSCYGKWKPLIVRIITYIVKVATSKGKYFLMGQKLCILFGTKSEDLAE